MTGVSLPFFLASGACRLVRYRCVTAKEIRDSKRAWSLKRRFLIHLRRDSPDTLSVAFKCGLRRPAPLGLCRSLQEGFDHAGDFFLFRQGTGCGWPPKIPPWPNGHGARSLRGLRVIRNRRARANQIAVAMDVVDPPHRTPVFVRS